MLVCALTSLLRLLHPHSALVEHGGAPWDVKHRRVWPRSFRVAVRDGVMRTAVALALRAEDAGMVPPATFWILMLSFCSRDWFVPLSQEEEEAVVEAPPSRIYWCDWCQLAPIQRKLQVCSKCYSVRYCSKECLVEAWSAKVKPHKVLCKAVQAEKKLARPKKASS